MNDKPTKTHFEPAAPNAAVPNAQLLRQTV